MALFDEYIPADVPAGEIDPKELERAKYLALMRLGLGMAGREPLGSAAGGAMKAYVGAQANARQQMLAQLQAYKARQEIGAKAKGDQQSEALRGDLKNIYGSMGIPASGGPTETNATLGAIAQYRQAAARLMQEGRVEDAKRASDIADGMEEQFGQPQNVRTPAGAVRLAQFSKRGTERVSELSPAEKLQFASTGGMAGVGLDPFTGQQVSAGLPVTMSPSDKISAGNLNLAQQRFAHEKSAPVWDPGSGQFVTRPTAAAPTGSAFVPEGFVLKKVNAPEAYTKQVGGIVNTNTAITNYLSKLKGFSNIDLANTTKRAEIGTAYNNTMLQLKEAYNLGVLNGPDYDILTTVITDPLSGKGAITSNAAIEAQAKQIRGVLRENALNLAKVHKQPLSDIDALLPPTDQQPAPPAAPLTAAEQAELERLRAKHGRR